MAGDTEVEQLKAQLRKVQQERDDLRQQTLGSPVIGTEIARRPGPAAYHATAQRLVILLRKHFRESEHGRTDKVIAGGIEHVQVALAALETSPGLSRSTRQARDDIRRCLSDQAVVAGLAEAGCDLTKVNDLTLAAIVDAYVRRGSWDVWKTSREYERDED